MKYKSDCATKIQRYWREIKGSKKYIEAREKGNRMLAGRKERRRFSLLGYRRFWGDYLACNVRNSAGGFLVKAIGLSEPVRFSCRGEILHAKFGRSSMRSERIFLITAGKFLIVVEQVVQNQLSYAVERTIPISSIRSVALSNLRDDWFALNVGSKQEPDPLLWSTFKTELISLLSVQVQIDATIQYNKKPGKPSTVKFQKDPSAPSHYDLYKSGVVRVVTGQPPNSVSEPVPKPKPKAAKATTTRKTAPRVSRVPVRQPARQPTAQPLPNQTTVQPLAQPAELRQAVQPVQPVQQTPQTAVSAKRISRVPPPPPPVQASPPAAGPAKPAAKALYDYVGSKSNELSITKNEVIIIIQKADNGWWLAERQDGSAQGWTPASYVEELRASPAPSQKKAPPPAPPKKKKAVQSPGTESLSASSSSQNLASGLAEALRQKNQATNNLAGGLANALKARAGRHDSDEDGEEW